MVYRGKVHNGQIVIEAAPRLAEGLEVIIEPVVGEPAVGSVEAILPSAGIWADQKEEMDASLAELRAMKEEEVRRQAGEREAEL